MSFKYEVSMMFIWGDSWN